MKMSKKLREFFTLTRRAEGGFTLIELIIVVAIIAILGGVGVPAYSGYVEKANRGADQSLAGEVAHALSLYYYRNNGQVGGYVVLGANAAADEFGDEAMKAAFGDNWKEVVALKYDGWKGLATDQEFAEAYLDSSYSGNEDALITQIGDVTNILKDVLASSHDLVGGAFNKYLTDNGVDTKDNQAVSNAAILYAADTIGNMDATKEAAVNKAFQNFYDPEAAACGKVSELTMALQNELGTYGAVAAIYAHGEAFGQYAASNGNTDLLTDFHNIDTESITDTNKALEQIGNNLSTMVETAKILPYTSQYIGNNQYAKDVKAYLESMKKINANADKFTDKLGSAGCYTDGTAAALLQTAVTAGSQNVSCGDGEILVMINKDGKTYDSISAIQN